MDFDDNDDRSWLNKLVAASLLNLPDPIVAGEDYETDSMDIYYGGRIVPTLEQILEKASNYPDIRINEEVFEGLDNKDKVEIDKFLTPEDQPDILKVAPESKMMPDEPVYPKNNPDEYQFNDNDKLKYESKSKTKGLLEELSMEDINKIEDFETKKTTKKNIIGY